MEPAQKKSLADLFKDRQFLTALPFVGLLLGVGLWALWPASAEPVLPSALNATVPQGSNDSTRLAERLNMEGGGNGAAGGLQTAMPSSLNSFVYRDENGRRNVGADSMGSGLPSMNAGPQRMKMVPRAGLPASLPPDNVYRDPAGRGGSGRGGSSGGMMSEADFGIGTQGGPPEEIQAAESQRKEAQLKEAMAKQAKLMALMEQYQRDKVDKLAREKDKSVVRKAGDAGVVSGLDTKPRNGDRLEGNSFYGLYTEDAAKRDAEQLTAETGAIRALVYGDQQVVAQGRVKMRLLEPITIRGVTLPANTLLYGVGAFGAERVQIRITSLVYKDHILPCQLSVYDMDGMVGIYVPDVPGLTETRQAVGQAGNGVNINAGGGLGRQSAPAMAGMAAAQAATQVGRQLLTRRTTIIKAHLKNNYYVLLRANQSGSGGGNGSSN